MNHMDLKELDEVVLTREIPELSTDIHKGNIGTVLKIIGDHVAFMVEFFNPDGSIKGIVTLSPDLVDRPVSSKMTAEDFLDRVLGESSLLLVFSKERTEQYRELWTTSKHPKIDGYSLMHLLCRLEDKGFTFKFTDMDSFKITAPHYDFHKREKETLIDGWSCGLGSGVNLCEGD